MLECTLTTVRGVSSTVDIVWNSNASDVSIIEGVNETIISTYSVVYQAYYTIPLLSTTDDGRVYECEVVINTSPPVMATGSVTLDVTGLWVS